MRVGDDVLVADERCFANGRSGRVKHVARFSENLTLVDVDLGGGGGCAVPDIYLRILETKEAREARRADLEERAAGGGTAGRVARFVLDQAKGRKVRPL